MSETTPDAGRALDVRVAEKVMGWRVFTAIPTQSIGMADPHQGDHAWLDDPANYPHIVDYGDQLLLWRVPDGDGELWAPSTDWAAAGEVLDHHPYFVSLIRSVNVSRFGFADHMTWKCRFYAPQSFEVEADTAPLAVCRAALAALEASHDL